MQGVGTIHRLGCREVSGDVAPTNVCIQQTLKSVPYVGGLFRNRRSTMITW